MRLWAPTINRCSSRLPHPWPERDGTRHGRKRDDSCCGLGADGERLSGRYVPLLLLRGVCLSEDALPSAITSLYSTSSTATPSPADPMTALTLGFMPGSNIGVTPYMAVRSLYLWHRV